MSGGDSAQLPSLSTYRTNTLKSIEANQFIPTLQIAAKETYPRREVEIIRPAQQLSDRNMSYDEATQTTNSIESTTILMRHVPDMSQSTCGSIQAEFGKDNQVPEPNERIQKTLILDLESASTFSNPEVMSKHGTLAASKTPANGISSRKLATKYVEETPLPKSRILCLY